MKNSDTDHKLVNQQEEDAKLAQAANDAIRMDTELGKCDIEALALRGKVVIQGTVSTFPEKDKVEKLVARVPGVKEVDNSLSVGVASDNHSSPT